MQDIVRFVIDDARWHRRWSIRACTLGRHGARRELMLGNRRENVGIDAAGTPMSAIFPKRR
jgi:hypothetical protein